MCERLGIRDREVGTFHVLYEGNMGISNPLPWAEFRKFMHDTFKTMLGKRDEELPGIIEEYGGSLTDREQQLFYDGYARALVHISWVFKNSDVVHLAALDQSELDKMKEMRSILNKAASPPPTKAN